MSFYHYDLYAQALAKIERSHAQDLEEVREMIRSGSIEPHATLRHFNEIEPRLYLYPAVDPSWFRRSVEEVLQLQYHEGDKPS